MSLRREGRADPNPIVPPMRADLRAEPSAILCPDPVWGPWVVVSWAGFALSARNAGVTVRAANPGAASMWAVPAWVYGYVMDGPLQRVEDRAARAVALARRHGVLATRAAYALGGAEAVDALG